ncbi:hypothetical protein WN55_07320, partial [Dufourea novaeangliae]
CVVPQCPSKSKNPSHHFPQKENEAQKWVVAVKNQKLLSLSHKELVKRLVCWKHFAEQDYKCSSQRRNVSFLLFFLFLIMNKFIYYHIYIVYNYFFYLL